MGRIIGLIGGTCLVIAVLRLTNLQYEDQTLLGGVDPNEARQVQRLPRELLKHGKELYLRGRYTEALTDLQSAAAAGSGLTTTERQQAQDYLTRCLGRLNRQNGVTTRGQSSDADPFAITPAAPAKGVANDVVVAPGGTDGKLPKNVTDAARVRVERLMVEAMNAHQKGKTSEAMGLAKQAEQISREAKLTFAKGAATPTALLAKLQAGAGGEADWPEWARDAGPVQQTAAVEESSSAIAPTGSPKEQAAQLVALARADIKSGRFEEARQKALQAKALDVPFDLFEDRPELVLNDVDRRTGGVTYAAKSNGASSAPVAAATDSDKQKVAALLELARKDIEAGNLESARDKAVQASEFQVAYKLFEDQPELVLQDIDARMAFQNVAQKNGGRPATDAKQQAKVLLGQARQALAAGQLEEARRLASDAEKLKAPYELFDDRPEVVLADIAQMSRPSNTAGAMKDESFAAAAGVAEPAARSIPDSAPGSIAAAGHQAADDQWGAEPAVATVTTAGLSAAELYSQGLAELNRGNREGAYSAFLAAHQTGEQLNRAQAQRLQDYLRDLSPRGDKGIQRVRNEVEEPVLSGAPDAIGAAEQQHSVQFDRLRTETLNAVFKAERLRDKDPEKALDLVDQAMASVEGAGLPEEQSAVLLRSLNKTRSSLQSEITRQQPNLEQSRKNTETLNVVEIDNANKIRIEQEFAKLVDEFNELMKQRRFADAEVVAKKAALLNPRDPVAVSLVMKAQLGRRVHEIDNLKDAKEKSFYNQLWDVETAVVVEVGDANPLKFGDDFKDITNRRKGRYGVDNRPRSSEERKIEESLGRRISLHEDNVPLGDIIAKIRTLADINIVVDSAGLEEEGVNSNYPVSIDVDGITVRSALNLILEPQGLGYMIKDEVLKITSRIRQQGELEVRTYSVADLVVPIPVPDVRDGMPWNFGANQMMMPGAGGMSPMAMGANPQGIMGAAMAGGQGFAQMGPGAMGLGPQPVAGRTGGPRNTDFNTLTELLQSTISPDSWIEGGGKGAVQHYETTLSLVIRQTQKVHEEIADLLDQLRRLQDLQVTIEVRFVTVTDRFFERIGIDFDFNIQDSVGGPTYDNSGRPLNAFGTPILPGFGLTGTTQSGQQGGQQSGGQQSGGQQQGQQGQSTTTGGLFTQGPTRQLTNVDQYKSGTIVGLNQPGTFNPSLDIPFQQGSFEVGVPTFGGYNPQAGVQMGLAILSDIEAFFFIQAAQGDARTNLMFAPKVTTFNGVPGFITDNVSRPFVISVVPTVGFFSTGFQPIIQFVPDGVFLTVTPVVSADRRYVRLTVQPQFFSVTDVFTFSFAGGGTGGQQGQQGGQQGQQGGQQGQQGQQGGPGLGIGGSIGSAAQMVNAIMAQGVSGGVGGGGGQGGQQGQQGGNNNLGASTTITVQQPVVETVNTSTTVSVPDGGTVLLGGVKRLREGRNMSGVPILNKIPYISRLFKNTGVGRETESLMLMVTPRIVIQEEEEELLGVSATSP
ncbi:hypothetical protein [Planctellipticum variicoloris]|uniref:hypothetical protein n=1 Tax=Planctellipticum variicoloris TaxID=3064265 RepID=UPI0030137D04|nr:hypothetical protein SH412_001028 [Planctomycetaceae bacterium SH412]